MSDAYFDADRASGKYPPKGFGRMSDDQKRVFIEKRLEPDLRAPWMVYEGLCCRVPAVMEFVSEYRSKHEHPCLRDIEDAFCEATQ